MLTLTEAAASLGVAASSLRHQIRNGKLKARKVGPAWTVTEREVERYRRESLGRHQAASSSAITESSPRPIQDV
jgi:excisionase family DNA binding protein